LVNVLYMRERGCNYGCSTVLDIRNKTVVSCVRGGLRWNKVAALFSSASSSSWFLRTRIHSSLLGV